MKPGIKHLDIYQGSGFEHRFNWTDADDQQVELAAYTAKCSFWEYYGGPLILQVTHAAGIALADTDPNLILTLTDTQTGAMSVEHFVYALEIHHASVGTLPFARGTCQLHLGNP